LITATHPASLASLSDNFSLSYFESVFSIAFLSSFTLATISDLSQAHQIIVVFHFSEITFLAFQRSSTFAFSSFIQSSLVIIFAQVNIAISFKISFFLSPNQGALIHKIFKTHFNLFKIIVVSASHSISSAIITKSFLPLQSNSSSKGSKSFILLIFQSVIRI
jgi:hypothetical protein